MFLATLHTLDNTVVLHIAALTLDNLERMLTPFSNIDAMANDYKVYSNGRSHIPTDLTDVSKVKFHHDAKLSDLRRYLPKHPGGRPAKPTHCKVCNKLHESYTLARACCWKERLGK